MHHGGRARRCLGILVAGLLLSAIALPDARAGEWETMRQSYDNKVRAHANRIAQIEAKERGVPADQEKRADKITRDRITAIKASRKGSGRGKSLAATAEKAALGEMALGDVSREQGEYLDVVRGEWGAEGTERKKLREAISALEKNLERINANLAGAADAAGATAASVQESGVRERVARIEAEAGEAGERLRARWQREHSAQERAREQREREAAERVRSLR
jgi:hypothetical protein